MTQDTQKIDVPTIIHEGEVFVELAAYERAMLGRIERDIALEQVIVDDAFKQGDYGKARWFLDQRQAKEVTRTVLKGQLDAVRKEQGIELKVLFRANPALAKVIGDSPQTTKQAGQAVLAYINENRLRISSVSKKAVCDPTLMAALGLQEPEVHILELHKLVASQMVYVGSGKQRL